MRFLTDTEIEHVKQEREAVIAKVAREVAGDFWKNLSLSDLAILRAEHKAIVDACDELISVRVNNGRRAGGSWAEIGKILGISKQAAQQRFS
jgi:hypothetical protein